MIRSIDCTDVYIQQWIAELLMLIAAAIVLTVLCVLERRQNKSKTKKSCCTFIIPVDLMEMKGHSSMILATFTLATIKILNVLVLNNGMQFNPEEVMLKILIALISIVLMSLTFLPLLACITANTVASNILGLLYATLYISLAIVVITPACSIMDMSLFQIAITIEFNIAIIISGLLLIIKFILRLLGKSYTREEIIFKTTMEQVEYVKQLLQKSVQSEGKNLKRNNGGCCKWKLYKNITGFRYSLTILVSIYVGMLAVTGILIVYIASFCDKFYKFQNEINDWKSSNDTDALIPPILRTVSNFVLLHRLKDQQNAHLDLIITFIDRQGTSIFAAAIISLLLAFFSAIYHSLSLAKSYRRFKLSLKHRKSLEKLLDLDELPNAFIVVRAMQFAGFQIAYLIWGYHVQAGLVFLVCLFLTETIILPSDSLLEFIINFLKAITPLAVFIIFTAIVQHFLVRKHFLYDNGKILVLKNRKGFLNLLYIMLFYNIFNGTFACINRFMKWLFTGIWFYLRLDRTTLARGLEKCDLGFVCFASLLKIENSENNPIVHTFLALFSKECIIDQYMQQSAGENYQFSKFPKTKTLAYKRWFLAWTLMHNKSLINDRKSNQQNNTKM